MLKASIILGSTIPVESHHTPISASSTSQPPTSSPSIQTTHVAEESATMPHDSPLPRVHSLESDESSMTLNELMVLCTTLSNKVETLESDLKETKLTYGAAYTKLIMKVKKLEHKVKSSKARRRVRLVVSEDEDELEDPSKQGRKIAQINEDEGITLVQMSAQTQGRHEYDFEEFDYEFIAPEDDYTAEPDISTANVPVSTASAEVNIASPEVKTAAEKEDKVATRARKTGLEEALRLQEQLDEEERQRIARVHEEASTFNAEGIDSWNEFSSTMASVIICLSINQKINLSKYIFDNMMKNLDGGVKFLMYPRFVQVFLDKQVEGMTRHKPSHAKKVFANIKRPCKGFSGRVTPLFSTMMVQATEDMGADSATPTDSHSIPIISQPSSSKPQKKNLQEKVLDLEKAKTAQAKEITSLKKRVKQLEKRMKSRTSGLRRLRKVGSSSRVESSIDASLGAQEDASK
ncbi:hypothetical protein Tco_0906922 [Tanacetum coccineum]|uniref:Uncharacterized protein n=1 Tax=Tanacetum coccineum TaxID=301880 RepID=A0ABQ5CJ85_9ASTR